MSCFSLNDFSERTRSVLRSISWDHGVCVLSLLSLAVYFFGLVVVTAAEVSAESSRVVVRAEAALQTLERSDPVVKRLPEWEELAAEISRQIEAQTSDAPALLFQLGKLHERIFQRRGSRASLARSLEAYERLARSYAGHVLADDALLALGDLRRSALNDEVAARAAFFEIVDRYPSGAAAREAKVRLAPPAPLDAAPSSGSVSSREVPSKSSAVLAGTRRGSQLSELESEAESTSLFLAQEKQRAFAPTGKRTREVFARKPVSRRPLVVIDAGHGGDDLGAVGPDGELEKDIVLNIAKFLDELLRERLRARTVLTRTSDVFIPLPERTRIANEQNADLFISIHANASELKTASGIETYYLDNTNDKASLRLAERENMSMQFGGGAETEASDLGFIMSDLIQNVKLDDSISLAHKIQDSLHATLSQYYDGVNNLGVKKAPFYVLVGAHMPCVLTEVSFLDHPVEGRRLIDRKYQKLVASALFQGIRQFFAPREER